MRIRVRDPQNGREESLPIERVRRNACVPVGLAREVVRSIPAEFSEASEVQISDSLRLDRHELERVIQRSSPYNCIPDVSNRFGAGLTPRVAYESGRNYQAVQYALGFHFNIPVARSFSVNLGADWGIHHMMNQSWTLGDGQRTYSSRTSVLFGATLAFSYHHIGHTPNTDFILYPMLRFDMRMSDNYNRSVSPPGSDSLTGGIGFGWNRIRLEALVGTQWGREDIDSVIDNPFMVNVSLGFDLDVERLLGRNNERISYQRDVDEDNEIIQAPSFPLPEPLHVRSLVMRLVENFHIASDYLSEARDRERDPEQQNIWDQVLVRLGRSDPRSHVNPADHMSDEELRVYNQILEAIDPEPEVGVHLPSEVFEECRTYSDCIRYIRTAGLGEQVGVSNLKHLLMLAYNRHNIDQMGLGRPIAVVTMTRDADWNDGFREHQPVRALLESNQFDVLYFPVSNDVEAHRVLGDVVRQTGSKINKWIDSGHGNSDSINYGRGSDQHLNQETGRLIRGGSYDEFYAYDTSDLTSQFLDLPDFFERNAEIIHDSCSNGEGGAGNPNNIVNAEANLFRTRGHPVTIHSVQIPSSMGLEVLSDGRLDVHFGPRKYYREIINGQSYQRYMYADPTYRVTVP